MLTIGRVPTDIKTLVFAGICATSALTFLFLFAFGWDALTPTQYGLLYNKITKKYDDKIYEAGRHYVGVYRHFVPFPKTLVTIEFSHNRGATALPLETRTREGLALELELSFQYQLNKTTIPSLNAEFLTDYQDTFVRVARESVLQTASGYIATAWFSMRGDIATHMLTALNADLSIVYANIVALQILSIMLPDSWENAIELTQIEQQNIKKSQFLQNATLVRALTNQTNFEAAANITMINANATAECIYWQNVAKMAALNYTQTAVAVAYAALKSAFNFSAAQLVEYLTIKAVKLHNTTRIVLSVDSNASSSSVSSSSSSSSLSSSPSSASIPRSALRRIQHEPESESESDVEPTSSLFLRLASRSNSSAVPRASSSPSSAAASAAAVSLSRPSPPTASP